ncbi:meteorin-like protein [Clupea harengus]|uniref:Meteorin-like protein n=1 Tax=Clupea harengus TaxID=7950 RepID=A0A6P8F5A4_CLUHA|nr:meteorin-like protein [Clupea harengus]
MFVLVFVYAVSAALLWPASSAQYSSDQCNWKGSGLTHEAHTRDVEQVYLRCSQGSLEWLYPTGALVVNLRPNLPPSSSSSSSSSSRLRVCLKPQTDSQGSMVYLERGGRLKLLLGPEEQALGAVRCFRLDDGALFVEALPHSDIGRRTTAFAYEMRVEEQEETEEGGEHTDAALCRPCSDEEVLMAVCTSDFAGRGSLQPLGEREAPPGGRWLKVSLSRLYRQKTRIFTSSGGGARARRAWTGHVRAPPHCPVSLGDGGTGGGGGEGGGGDYLLTGAVRLGEAWLGCVPRYQDFLQMYRAAQARGTNPCSIDTD